MEMSFYENSAMPNRSTCISVPVLMDSRISGDTCDSDFSMFARSLILKDNRESVLYSIDFILDV